MKIAILYSSLTPHKRESSRQTSVIVGGVTVYIRAEEIITTSVDQALYRAKPREDETVLNTIPLELPPPSALEKAKAVLDNVLAST